MASVVLALAACSASEADLPSSCAMPTERTTRTLGASDPVPVLAMARGTNDLAVAYVDRPMLPRLAHLVLQRVALDGTMMGDPIVLGPVDQEVPGPVTLAFDGDDYLACTTAVGGASCARVDPAGHATDADMVVDALALAITRGAAGVMGAWIDGDGLEVGPLDAPTGTLAHTDAMPSIASNDHGYVVGYEADASAWIATLDEGGRAAAPISLGPALAATRVAVAFAGTRIGASFVAPSGDVMAAVIDGSEVHSSSLGAGATSHGQVAIAPASDGFFVTWSDTSGSIEGTFVDTSARPMGARFSHAVGTTDAVQALVALRDAYVLAVPTTLDASPVDVTILGCP